MQGNAHCKEAYAVLRSGCTVLVSVGPRCGLEKRDGVLSGCSRVIGISCPARLGPSTSKWLRVATFSPDSVNLAVFVS